MQTIKLTPVLHFVFANFIATAAWNVGSVPDIIHYQLENGTFVDVYTKPPKKILCYVPKVGDVKFRHYFSESGYGSYRDLKPYCRDNCYAGLSKNRRTVLVAHGYWSSPDESIGIEIRNAFRQKREKYNLIFIDWAYLASTKFYWCAKGSLKFVGVETAKLLNYLYKKRKISMARLTYVGHSLGCHIPNFLKSYMQYGSLAYLHALDPAGVGYTGVPDHKRLDHSDARFVSVIHTDSAWYGTSEQWGHADFYPNGGYGQPGCPTFAPYETCSHNRVYSLFAESIVNPNAFDATPCRDPESGQDCDYQNKRKNKMGWHSNKPSGIGVTYFLETNAGPPYSKRRRNLGRRV